MGHRRGRHLEECSVRNGVAETLGESTAASWVESGVMKVLREDIQDVSAGKMGYSTTQVGDLVKAHIQGLN